MKLIRFPKSVRSAMDFNFFLMEKSRVDEGFQYFFITVLILKCDFSFTILEPSRKQVSTKSIKPASKQTSSWLLLMMFFILLFLSFHFHLEYFSAVNSVNLYFLLNMLHGQYDLSSIKIPKKTSIVKITSTTKKKNATVSSV